MYLLISSTIFLMVTTYAVEINYKKDRETLITSEKTPPLTQVCLFFILILSFVLLTRNFTNIFDIKWYFSLIICFLTTLFFNSLFGKLYINLFGVKKKRKLLDITYHNIKDNNYVVDAIITLTIGTLLHLLSNNF